MNWSDGNAHLLGFAVAPGKFCSVAASRATMKSLSTFVCPQEPTSGVNHVAGEGMVNARRTTQMQRDALTVSATHGQFLSVTEGSSKYCEIKSDERVHDGKQSGTAPGRGWNQRDLGKLVTELMHMD